MRSLRKSLVMDLNVFDNFLSDQEFDRIQRMCLDPSIPWYWTDHTNVVGDGKPQLTHMVFLEKSYSDLFQVFNPLSHKFPKFKSWKRIKMNTNPRTSMKKNLGYHVDYSGMRSAIYYVNTTNGGTKFKGGPFVKGIANRLVVFKSDLLHAGITCTNQSRKVVINFNYHD